MSQSRYYKGLIESLFEAAKCGDLSAFKKIERLVVELNQTSILLLRNEAGQSLFHVAIQNNSHSIFTYLYNSRKSEPGFREALLSLDNNKHSLVRLAVNKNNLPLVKLLLDHYKTHDWMLQDTNGETPLHVAAKFQDGDIINFLISKIASSDIGELINTEDKEKNLPLHIALRCGHASTIAHLIQLGSAIHKTNNDGLSFLIYFKKHPDLFNSITLGVHTAKAMLNTCKIHSDTCLSSIEFEPFMFYLSNFLLSQNITTNIDFNDQENTYLSRLQIVTQNKEMITEITNDISVHVTTLEAAKEKDAHLAQTSLIIYTILIAGIGIVLIAAFICLMGSAGTGIALFTISWPLFGMIAIPLVAMLIAGSIITGVTSSAAEKRANSFCANENENIAIFTKIKNMISQFISPAAIPTKDALQNDLNELENCTDNIKSAKTKFDNIKSTLNSAFIDLAEKQTPLTVVKQKNIDGYHGYQNTLLPPPVQFHDEEQPVPADIKVEDIRNIPVY